jgi:DNA repair exonuclease SbcCD ATPase subunit
MKPKALSIQGFRSFDRDSVLPFQNDSSFVLVTGDNQINPELGGNASGKSTLWDALSWVLYGKSIRGLKGKSLVNWTDTSLCSVCFEFEKDGKAYSISRSYDPISISLREEGDKSRVLNQSEVDQFIGIDYGCFCNSIVLGQFNRYFFDLRPNEKLTLFSNVLDLDRWIDASEKASASAKSARVDLQDSESQQETTKARLEEVEGQVDATEKSYREHEESAKNRRRTLQTALRKARTRLESISLSDLDERIGELEESRRKRERRLHSLAEEKQGNGEKRAQLREKLLGASEKREEMVEALEKLRSNKDVCPTCSRPISKAVYLKSREELKENIFDTEEQKKSIKARLESLDEELRGNDRSTALAIRSGENEEANLGRLTQSRKGLSDEMSKWEGEVKSFKQQLKTETSTENPHEKTLKSLKKRRKKLKEEYSVIKREVKNNRKHLSYAEYWIKGFKELRLWIVDKALRELEIHVNNSLVELGLEGWEIEFDVERPKADGGMTSGFSVFILAPGLEEPVPWEVWCGGETQRLRIAGSAGLADLIRSRRGVAFNLEVWDEPTHHLSQEGIDDLLRYLSARAKEEDRQIWMTDHHTLVAGDFDHQITVVKDENGSHVGS